MKHHYYLLLLLLLYTMTACHNTPEPINKAVSDTSAGIKYPDNDTDYIITGISAGRLHVGQTLIDMRKLYAGCKIDSEPVWDYCVDGGGYGFRVSKGKDTLLFVYTSIGYKHIDSTRTDSMYVKDTISGIIVLNNRFHTKEGIHVGNTVRDILKLNPNIRVTLNLMCIDYETYSDKASGAECIFQTTDKTRVGIYTQKNMFGAVKPTNLTPCVKRIFCTQNKDRP